MRLCSDSVRVDHTLRVGSVRLKAVDAEASCSRDVE